jgi:hypothetical protein
MKKMKLIHYIILAAVVVLTSCGDFNENLDGFDKDTYKPTDVKKLEVELTDADYEKIASLMKDDDLKAKKFFISGSYAHSAYPYGSSRSIPRLTTARR